MHSAAAIIEALNARARPPARLREAARVSWGAWLGRLAERPGRVTGAPAQGLVDVLAARPVRMPPPRAAALDRWQAFAVLWRQQWAPASRDERGWRWAAGGMSFVWHVLLMVALAWIAAMHYVAPLPWDEEAVQAEFIGEGTPGEEGGGDPPRPAERASAADAAPAPDGQPSPRTPTPRETMPVPDVVAAIPDVATREVPEPRPESQPLTVTEPVAAEPPVFELPPTTPPAPPVAAPDISRAVPMREVDVPEPVRAPRVEITAPRVAAEPLPSTAPSVARRDIPAPVRPPTLAAPAPDVSPRALDPRAPALARRDVPAPDPAPGRPAPASPAPGVGSGPRTAPAPGSWATPRRADDWGDSDRNVPGRGDGVFDGDGRPRIAAAPGSAAPGQPPGTHTEEIADLDRAGTWLRRKALPYEPTRFDRFWRPNETLLEEWVRRGYKQVSIPIPGSSKRVVCAVSILQFGGGCWAVDPNVNEQPATARPPPDVPFKPHLQEDPGLTAPPAQAPASGG